MGDNPVKIVRADRVDAVARTVTMLFFTLLFVINFASLPPSIAGAKDFQHTLGHLKARAPLDVQAAAAHQLIDRYLGKESKKFKVNVNPNIGPQGKDTFKVNHTS